MEAGAVSCRAHGEQKKADRTKADLETYRLSYQAIRRLIEISGKILRVTKGLEKLLESHRGKSMVSCPETCFCWDVEAYLAKQEAGVEVEASGKGEGK